MSVRDTGPGIPKDEIPKVMQAFGQGSLAHQNAEGGTGLGLPIVKNLVELHGGYFELKSELRKGTEVTAYLPKQRTLASVGPLQPLGQERHRTSNLQPQSGRPAARAPATGNPAPSMPAPKATLELALRASRPSRLKSFQPAQRPPQTAATR